MKGVGCPDRELFHYCSAAPRPLGSAKGCVGRDLPPPLLITYGARQKLALQPFLKRNGSELKRFLLTQDQTGTAGLISVVEIAIQRAVRLAQVIQKRHQSTPWASIDASGRIDTRRSGASRAHSLRKARYQRRYANPKVLRLGTPNTREGEDLVISKRS